MKILLIAKHVAGGSPGEFHHPGEWCDTFQLGLALAARGVNVAILTAAVHRANRERFRLEFGERLRQAGIRHYFAPTHVRVGAYPGSFRWRMFLGELSAWVHHRPDLVFYVAVGPSLLIGLPGRPPMGIISCWSEGRYEGRAEDQQARTAVAEAPPLLAAVEDRLFRFLARRWGAMTKEDLLRRTDAYAIMHPRGYAEARQIHEQAHKVFLLEKGVERAAADAAKPGDLRFDALFLGAIIHRKGIYDLVEAFGQVRQALPEATLGIAGSGPPQNMQRFQAALAAAPRNITYLGPVSYADRWSLLKGARVFAFPSRNDFYNSSLLEAMACGLPVITTSAVDAPMQEGISGFYVEPGDVPALAQRIIWLLQHEEERAAMGQRARDRVHDWNEVAGQLLSDIVPPLLKTKYGG